MQRTISWPVVTVAIGMVLVMACSKSSTKGERRIESVTRCQSDDECRLSCIGVDECCGDPCQCEQVRHRQDHRRIEQQRDCEKFDHATCPNVSCAEPEYAVEPQCKRGRCVAKRIDRGSPPAPIDLTDFDRSCQADADCVVVERQPCTKCSCPSAPISRREAARLEVAMQGVKCPSYDPWPDVDCGACSSVEAYCHDGQCSARESP